jgi:hypothetical protein
VKAATLHRSDFVQQNAANTKTNNMDNVSFHDMCWSQVSRRCPPRFNAISKSEQLVPVQPFGRTFEGVRTVAAVRTIELHRSDARSNYSEFDTELYFKRHYLGWFCQTSGRCRNMSGRYPVVQNILGLHPDAARQSSNLNSIRFSVSL